VNALWPTISSRRGAAAATLISAASTLSGVFLYFLLEGDAIAREGSLALVYPALLGIIAWRTWRLSRAWSLIGVVLAALAAAASVVTESSPMGVLGFLATLTGYRGVRAVHRLDDG
jgi:hypothetical protein